MNEETLLGYTEYVTRLFGAEDEALTETRAAIEREKMPIIHVSPSQGKIISVIARLVAPKRILELGTLGGYSAIWLARTLPEDGKLISLELDAHHAEVSARNIEHAGLASKVEVRVGPAADTLRRMRAAGEAPFDLVFIDADKPGYPEYLELTVPMVRSGGVILADNTLPGDVLKADADTGITRYNKAVAEHPELDSIVFPVLRERGLDGMLMSIKK